jgi:hypothetical protein
METPVLEVTGQIVSPATRAAGDLDARIAALEARIAVLEGRS